MRHYTPGLSIDVKTGEVTWYVGADPWTKDTRGNPPVAPGYYNLVVMVEERKPNEAGILNRGYGVKVRRCRLTC